MYTKSNKNKIYNPKYAHLKSNYDKVLFLPGYLFKDICLQHLFL